MGRPLDDGEFSRRFAENLLRYRKAADLSQDLLADLAAIHRTEISQLERGLRIPRADTLVKLCVSLEVDPNELLEGIGWKPPRIDTGCFEFPPLSTAAED
jgi:transcriptional regulator with XRE-family HTH domain